MKFKFSILLLILATPLLFMYCGCKKDVPVTLYKTQNVIIVIVDGPRLSETWNLSTRQFIPHRASMLSKGVYCSQFYNNGTTSTNPGHTAICTGVYENLNNGGAEYPTYPSIFQYWLKTFERPKNEAWVIATKDKLEVLSDCKDVNWKGLYRPSTDCGNLGLGTGYREDVTTFISATTKLTTNHVRLALINFKQPDAAGHANDSTAYLQGILDTDNYIYQLWQQLQSDDFYKDRTTLIVTNDHGRHTPGYLDGFISHGDGCDGCRHIEFFAMGPDFKENYTTTTPYEQIDISLTIGELMGFAVPTSNGKVMRDIFRK
ncbi:MAG TPA: alkaline phosphatase family protein [Bacteroidia bacterium]|nr:alkaline phosphatase family protein [Bacteroidia bacterium]